MSILIKGMQMPELYETYKINVAKTREGKIVLGMSKLNETSYKPIGEVVELPEHHGRLIDADEMKNLWTGCSINGSISTLLDARPTVIEAE